jgi:hypothetical protein
MGYVEQVPELKTQSNTNIVHLRKTCQASIFAAMRSLLVVCSRPGVTLEPRAGTACPSHPAASLASDIRYVKYCGTESSRCLILWSSHSQTLLTQATNQEDKRICFPIVMRMRRSAQP